MVARTADKRANWMVGPWAGRKDEPGAARTDMPTVVSTAARKDVPWAASTAARSAVPKVATKAARMAWKAAMSAASLADTTVEW